MALSSAVHSKQPNERSPTAFLKVGFWKPLGFGTAPFNRVRDMKVGDQAVVERASQ